jgi:hypothetical protein
VSQPDRIVRGIVNQNGESVPEITSKYELITPEKAAEYLGCNHPDNRSAKVKRIKAMVAAIRNGQWAKTHQGIAFDSSGNLVDGQNRLRAIVEAGIAVEMLVTRGLAPSSLSVIDTQLTPRRKEDSLTISGNPTTRHSVATLFGMYTMGGIGSYSPIQQVSDMMGRHRQAITFADDMPKTVGYTAQVRGVLARAWYTCDRVRLAEFKEVFADGIARSGDDDGAAIRLRDLCRSTRMSRNSQNQRATYLRATSAVRAFLERRNVVRLMEAQFEFPLPGQDV